MAKKKEKAEKKESNLKYLITGLLVCVGFCVCGCPMLGLTAAYWVRPDLLPDIQPKENLPTPEKQQAMLEAHLQHAAQEMKDGSLNKLRELNSPIPKAWFVRNFGPRGNEFHDNLQTWEDRDKDSDYLRLFAKLKAGGERKLSVAVIQPGNYSQGQNEVMRAATTKITLLQVRFSIGADTFEVMGPLVYVNGGFRFLPVNGMLKKKR